MIWIIEKMQRFEPPAAVFLASVTIFLSFAIDRIANKYEPEVQDQPRNIDQFRVKDRFLERGTNYDAASLTNWVRSYPDLARGYAFPVLFPLDVLFMLFLGAFLALGSLACASSVDMVRSFAWFFALFPALYVVADLIEDTLLAVLLLSNELINNTTVFVAQSVTSVKLFLVIISIAQTIALSAWAFMQPGE